MNSGFSVPLDSLRSFNLCLIFICTLRTFDIDTGAYEIISRKGMYVILEAVKTEKIRFLIWFNLFSSSKYVTVGGFCNRLGKEYNCIHNASDLEILAIRVVSIVLMLFDGER